MIDVLDFLAVLPDPLDGRGPMRRDLDGVMAAIAAVISMTGGGALVIGAFGVSSFSAYVAFAGSVFLLDLVAAVVWYLAYLVGSLISVAVDRMLFSK